MTTNIYTARRSLSDLASIAQFLLDHTPINDTFALIVAVGHRDTMREVEGRMNQCR